MMKHQQEMKLWAVHFSNEDGDDYYESFRCVKQPTGKMLLKWWETSEYADAYPADAISVREVWEASLDAPVLGSKP